MQEHRNQFAQPIGAPLPGWSARPFPPRSAMEGRFCRVEPLDPERHTEDLFAANCEATEGRNWTYLPDDQGPHPSLDLYRRWAETAASGDDPLWHAIIDDESGPAVGVAAYARIDQISGVIEVGGTGEGARRRGGVGSRSRELFRGGESSRGDMSPSSDPDHHLAQMPSKVVKESAAIGANCRTADNVECGMRLIQQSQVRTRLAAGGGSHERTRL
jgi:hypothetical protein